MIKRVFQLSDIQPIHPFPARMAPSIIWESIPCNGRKLRVLDSMAGSGTTLVSVRAMGHQAIGCDTDPLALLIARSWCSDINPNKIKLRAELVLERALKIYKDISEERAYPSQADAETKQFIDYWFDDTNRCQLTALARSISRIHSYEEKTILWCAFSRLIITKKCGVSLAMDISHSRPHKTYEEAPIRAFDKFLHAVNYIIKKAPFNMENNQPPQIILRRADARNLPFASSSVDMVITSPPYLNAIDYIRGHKFTLVWMGYSIRTLRSLRAHNIGAERANNLNEIDIFQDITERMGDIEKLDHRHRNMMQKYIVDMNNVIAECRRVMKKDGKAIFVIGDSVIEGVFIRNSEAIIKLAEKNGLVLSSKITRSLPENKRYLPPPTSDGVGHNLRNRMRKEVILHFN